MAKKVVVDVVIYIGRERERAVSYRHRLATATEASRVAMRRRRRHRIPVFWFWDEVAHYTQEDWARGGVPSPMTPDEFVVPMASPSAPIPPEDSPGLEEAESHRTPVSDGR